MFSWFRNIRGVLDIQSVMVGAIVVAIIAAAGIGSTVGMMRMSSVNTGRVTALTMAQALDSYYVKYGHYPSDSGGVTVKKALQNEKLINGDAAQADTSVSNICIWTGNESISNATLAEQARLAPQHYVVVAKVPRTNDKFIITDEKDITPKSVKVVKSGSALVPETGTLPSWVNNALSTSKANGDAVSSCLTN